MKTTRIFPWIFFLILYAVLSNAVAEESSDSLKTQFVSSDSSARSDIVWQLGRSTDKAATEVLVDILKTQPEYRAQAVVSVLFRLRSEEFSEVLNTWMVALELKENTEVPAALVVIALRSNQPEVSRAGYARLKSAPLEVQRYILRELAACAFYKPPAEFVLLLKADLGSSNLGLSDAAATLVIRSEKDAILDYLKRELQNPDPARLARIAAIAARSKDASAINLVCALLKSDSPVLSEQVLLGFEKAPSAALEAPIVLVSKNEKDAILRSQFAFLLGKITEADSIKLLGSWFESGESSALLALAGRHDAPALALLKRGLESENPELRNAAAVTLGEPSLDGIPFDAKWVSYLNERFKSTLPLDPLWPALARSVAIASPDSAEATLNPFCDFPDASVRASVAGALALLKPSDSVALLSKLYGDMDRAVKEAACEGFLILLKRDVSEKAIDALSKDALFLKSKTCSRIISVLAKNTGRNSLALITRGLTDPDNVTKRRTLEGLLLSGDTIADEFSTKIPVRPSLYESLAPLTKNPDPAIRSRALVALERTGLKSSRAIVLAGLGDENADVRQAVMHSLTQFYSEYPMANPEEVQELAQKVKEYCEKFPEEARQFPDAMNLFESMRPVSPPKKPADF